MPPPLIQLKILIGVMYRGVKFPSPHMFQKHPPSIGFSVHRLLTAYLSHRFSLPFSLSLSLPPSFFPSLLLSRSLSLSLPVSLQIYSVSDAFRQGQEKGGECTIRDKIMAPVGLVWPYTRSINRWFPVPRSALMSMCWDLILKPPYPPSLQRNKHTDARAHPRTQTHRHT